MIKYLSTLKKNRLIAITLASLLSSPILFVFIIYFTVFLLGPPDITNEQNTVFYSNAGEVIGNERGIENRYNLNLNEVPAHLQQATLAIEDQSFFQHRGFDFKRIIKAALADIRSRSLKEGASTITQQYARNLYLTHEKTWSRKLKEAFYTIRLETFYTKEEILTGYLNTIYYGHGAYGAEAASQFYFNKNASELSLGESAMLAGIPKGPTHYSPLNNYQKAKGRQQHILQTLLNQATISQTAFSQAIEQEYTFKEEKQNTIPKIGPYFQDTALKEASQILNTDIDSIRSSGLKIYTTLNRELQQLLEEKIATTIDQKSAINIGATAMNPHTGEIEALVGGRDYQVSPFNRAISAKRMPGSTFKPFLYYEALTNNYTASTKLLSEETTFTLDDNETYRPRNYNGYYANEPITLAQAIALSDNIYAVKTNLFLGPENLVETAKDFGITSELPAVPSLALGTAAVSVHEMVRAYSMLANGGFSVQGHTIKKIVNKHGKVIYERDQQRKTQKLDPQTTFILTNLMTGMFDLNLNGYMPVTGASINNKLTRTYAGKSGSTPFDSWMIGYSPSLVTGIWTGYDKNEKIEKVKDTTYAKQIWASFMEAAHTETATNEFPVPSGLVQVAIDPETGARATPYCDTSKQMYFVKGTEPLHYCQTHLFDENTGPNNNPEEEERNFLERLFEIFSTN